MISKTERAEVRTLIRHRFKVLRGEVEQRERELMAELEQKITLRVGLPPAGQARREGLARIEATVQAANLTLDRQEVDLLTRLATGVLESEEARAFLAEIPTVSALVPAERLLELERSLGDGGVA